MAGTARFIFPFLDYPREPGNLSSLCLLPGFVGWPTALPSATHPPTSSPNPLSETSAFQAEVLDLQREPVEEQHHEQLAPSSSSDLLGSGGRPGTAELEWPGSSGRWRLSWHS